MRFWLTVKCFVKWFSSGPIQYGGAVVSTYSKRVLRLNPPLCRVCVFSLYPLGFPLGSSGLLPQSKDIQVKLTGDSLFVSTV